MYKNIIASMIITADPYIYSDDLTLIESGCLDPVSYMLKSIIRTSVVNMKGMDSDKLSLLIDYISIKLARYIVRQLIKDTIVYKIYVQSRN